MTKLPPPDKFKSWLAYAVATMDTHSPNIESLAGDGPEVSREEFRAAAEAELAEVVGQNVKTRKANRRLRAALRARRTWSFCGMPMQQWRMR